MSHCDNEWTFRFPDVSGEDGPLEIRPKTFTFSTSYGEYDYCKAKFSQDVGDMLRPHTEGPYGRLAEKHRVELCNEGETRYALLFRPQHVTYGSNYTHIEFRDLHEALDDGFVDKAWETVTLRDAYEAVWEARPNDLLQGIRWADTPQASSRFAAAEAADASSYLDAYFYDESTETDSLLGATTALDFRQVSPARALEELNQKFGLQTWIDYAGYLWVGIPEASERLHVAAPDDDRVWRWTDPSIRHPRDPIHGIVVKGTWLDDPRLTAKEEVAHDLFSDEEMTGEVQVHGVAYRQDIDDGETLTIEDTNVKRDAADHVAENILRNELKHKYSGHISINPQEGGEFTDPTDIRLGDFLHVVPDDDHFAAASRTTGAIADDTPVVHDEDSDCHPEVDNMVFLITGVQHRVNGGGRWEVNLDVTFYPFPDVYPIETKTRLFDPNEDEYIDTDDYWNLIQESWTEPIDTEPPF